MNNYGDIVLYFMFIVKSRFQYMPLRFYYTSLIAIYGHKGYMNDSHICKFQSDQMHNVIQLIYIYIYEYLPYYIIYKSVM